VHVLFYWLARVALMFAVFVALWGVGWQPWLAIAGATVVAWLISYAMFGSMHDAAARQMERWVSRRFVSVAGDAVAEDAVAEDAEAKVEGAPSPGATPRAASAAKPRAASPARPKAASPARPKPQPKVATRRSS
jgi:Protein of unknown function (DUF4229)